ncbi:hypothetical protein HHL28_14045 [Aerophototrophica crusticola]|uniref:Uncharacterized protein n=1 Tax=Aerophototrophica crusticola TaxID=1709002 RepID=A0A858R9I2_9PROT|nr:hypothetical protein HHL28_14045 [Rhodospirillaceae bacterium B3]
MPPSANAFARAAAMLHHRRLRLERLERAATAGLGLSLAFLMGLLVF